MGSKSYLSQQINLMTLSTTDLFTEEEYDLYLQILGLINDISSESERMREDKYHDPTVKEDLKCRKKEAQIKLDKLIASHAGTPRIVQLKRVLDTRLAQPGQQGVTWMTLKASRKISEFVSDESRMMGLHQDDVTFDKIVIKWKSLDILHQIVIDGIILPVLHDDGTVKNKHHIFLTASAGQLRVDKIQTMEENMFNKIRPRLFCGLTYDSINAKGGINVNKFMAYIALASSASLPWTDIDIDRFIVVDDFDTLVEEEFDNIDHDYTVHRGEDTVAIKHSDGIGMMLPKVSRKNMMLRGPFIKGLLTSFDYIRFCNVNNCKPVLTDIYGKEHDLLAENIQVVLFKSQFKLWKFYEDWDDYKRKFKENGCQLNVTNIEEDYIRDSAINYQFLQSLVHMSDEEIEELTTPIHDKIEGMLKDSNCMLQALRADPESENPYQKSLAIYPELLRDSYTKDTLRAIKTKLLLDAKSGKIKCRNKRLYAIPDMYAICEHLFLGIDEPDGLLKAGEVSAKMFKGVDELDCLRSPHLSMEHWIAAVVKDSNVDSWFYTNGLYMNCHDSMMMRLQGDWDGDQVNCISEPVIINAAKKELKVQNVRTLNYHLGKAPDKPIDKEEMFNGLKRAHENSGIGQVSNSITKIWNKEYPDYDMTKMLTFLNNVVIDAAKSGDSNSMEQYPQVYKRFLKAVGGKRGLLPAFFAFSKNGRTELHKAVKDRKEFAKPNDSTMNKISAKFDDIGNLNFSVAQVPPFNWQMMLKDNDNVYDIDAINTFCTLDDGNKNNLIATAQINPSLTELEDLRGFEFVKQVIIYKLTQDGKTLEDCYPSIVKYLFAGPNMDKMTHKQMFWRVFGDIAVKNIEHNLQTYTVCDRCGMKIPAWAQRHTCPKDVKGFFECCDCGAWVQRTNSRQVRCEPCQIQFRMETERQRQQKRYYRTKAV